MSELSHARASACSSELPNISRMHSSNHRQRGVGPSPISYRSACPDVSGDHSIGPVSALSDWKLHPIGAEANQVRDGGDVDDHFVRPEHRLDQRRKQAGDVSDNDCRDESGVGPVAVQLAGHIALSARGPG